MSESTSLPTPRSLGMRVLLLLLMCVAFHIATGVLIAIALLQVIFTFLNAEPNARLQAFGRSAGLYLGQIAAFASFATEEAPFPFSDWPAPSV
jgi:hypothetical protein